MPMESRDIMTHAKTSRQELGTGSRNLPRVLRDHLHPRGHTRRGVGGRSPDRGAALRGPACFHGHCPQPRASRGQHSTACSFANGLVAYLLIAVFTFLWMLLLIVPGIMAALSYSATFFALAVPGPTAWRPSPAKAMMYGHRWRLCCLAGRVATGSWWASSPWASASSGSART
ncbi:MAG: hypothetical protein MZV70_04905 [Desulfobacterales bacterium]|nr:hypothetical protein [Desulfobacterales bacterium]